MPDEHPMQYEYRMSGVMLDWPDDAVPPTTQEVAIENEWPGTIKPYRGFADRDNYDKAMNQLHKRGGYRVEMTAAGCVVVSHG